MLAILSIDSLGKTSLVIGGDFNAWAVEWGRQKTNKRASILLESATDVKINST